MQCCCRYQTFIVKLSVLVHLLMVVFVMFLVFAIISKPYGISHC